ncbi:MAG: hypothetical protein CMA63_01285 [Euryarchaeota archaeon]|nr:hypothetical protein [Euryarchaeota archaeon]|tara:strand:- start:25296 stop:25613 length:318 start_codon:yes stop_codon:yes gene_type:complete
MHKEEPLKEKLKRIREKLEHHIISIFDGKEMWYQEKKKQFRGTVNITTDEWGVSVRMDCDRHRPISLSGRWDVILAYSDHLGAQYAGWSLDFECPYPEWEEKIDV